MERKEIRDMNKKSGRNCRGISEKSFILSSLDRLYSRIYVKLAGGVFGGLFTSYDPDTGVMIKKISSKGTKLRDAATGIRQKIARNIEESVLCGFYEELIRFLLSLRLKVYGTFLMTFFAYAAGVSAVDSFVSKSNISYTAVTCLFLSFACLPLLFTGTTLYSALGDSKVGRLLISLTGNREKGYSTRRRGGRCNVAFLVGTFLGLATYFIPVTTIGMGVYRLLWIMTVLHSPDFGIVSLCFLMPFDSTMILVAEVCIVFVSYVLKLILGKRTLRLEAVDIMVLMFALMMGVGGVLSVSSESLKPMLVYLCFLSVYFLIRNLMCSSEWLKRCVVAAVCAGTIVALYGLFQYFTGMIGFSTQWLDESMFEGISGRAISTLENPNVLGEYLVLVLPMAAAFLFCRYGDAKGRLASFLAFGAMGLCLVVTWSRGAWLGIAVAAVLFLLVWSRKSLHFVWLFLLSLPHLPFVLPENILRRLLSIGNLADTSTAYRFNIWVGSFKMLPERIFSGIGIGSGAWSQVFPSYAVPGTEVAQHSHSLYLQIWIELGGMALLVFLIFIFTLMMSSFTTFGMLGDAGDSLISRIYTAPLKDDKKGGSSFSSANAEDLRVSRLRTAARMNCAAPLCGVLGVMVQGFTDNIWYNYRLYLMFWICLGICASYSSFHREKLLTGNTILMDESSSSSVADVVLSRDDIKNKKNRGSVSGTAKKDGVNNAKA